MHSASLKIRVISHWLVLPVFLLLSAFSLARAQETPGLSNYPDRAQVVALINQGSALCYANPDSAIYYSQKALQLCMKAGYTINAAKTLGNLGLAYVNKGDYKNGLFFYTRANELFSKKDSTEEYRAQILNNIASIYFEECKYDTAALYAYHAKDILKQDIHSPALSSIYLNLAVIWLRLGQYDFSLQYLKKGEEVARDHKNNSALSSLLAHTGVVYIEKHEFEKAKTYLTSALELAGSSGNTAIQKNARLNLGTVLLRQHTPLKALSLLEDVYQSKDPNPLYTASAAYNLGDAYYQLKQYKKAEQIILSVLAYADSIDMKQETAEAHKTLAKIYEAMGNYRASLKHQQTYVQLRDDQLNSERVQAINLMEMKSRTLEKDKEIAGKQLMILQQRDQIRQKNIWIISISAVIIILALAAFAFYRNMLHKQRLNAEKIRTLQQEKQIGELKAQMKGEEKERARIARDLHDGVTSQLIAIKLHIANLRSRKDGQVGPEELDIVLHELEDTTRELRKTSHNLLPDILLQSGLESAVIAFCDKIRKSTSLEIEFLVFGELPRLEHNMELSVYRIIQELVQNILKHAMANSILVQLSYQNGLLSITVEDNGTGYVRSSDTNGIGLQNIEERVSALNGHVDVVSNEGQGTTVYLEFDIKTISKEKLHGNKNSHHG